MTMKSFKQRAREKKGCDSWVSIKNVARLNKLIEQGYEVDEQGRLVHRVICWNAHGSIPSDWHVHHINQNRKDNTPENLIALPASLHGAVHRVKGYALPRKDIENMLKSYLNLKKRNPKVPITINIHVHVYPDKTDIIIGVDRLKQPY